WGGEGVREGTEAGVEESGFLDPENLVFPFGAHICAVEVDTETGEVGVVKYVAVDDVGPVVNPMIVEGQVVGGVAQGIGEALYEEAVYDEEGQLLGTSMTNYPVPSATASPTCITGNHCT